MAQIMRPRYSTVVGFKGASAERREQDSRPGASPSPAQPVASVAVYFFLEDTAPVFKMLQNLQRLTDVSARPENPREALGSSRKASPTTRRIRSVPILAVSEQSRRFVRRHPVFTTLRSCLTSLRVDRLRFFYVGFRASIPNNVCPST